MNRKGTNEYVLIINLKKNLKENKLGLRKWIIIMYSL